MDAMKIRCLQSVVAAVVLVAAGASTGWTAPAWQEPGPQTPAVQRDTGVPQGRVLGELTDQSGAVIRSGTVEAHNLESDVTWLAVTDAEGHFTIEGLPAGRYRVSAELPGFETAVRDEVLVGVGSDAAVNLVLAIERQEASVVVTARSTESALEIATDPKAPRQPLPAHDGADYLKAIPGFSVIRKGGTDGDPLLRGMAGSRLGILLDGQQIFGGCGGRMDPPTAYVYPAAYDRITVLKGPQTVRYAAGASAGVVLFERELTRAAAPSVFASGAVTGAAYGRHDEMMDVRVAVPSFYVQGGATRSHTDDYKDGSGAAVHSTYTRWSGNAAFGWTPDTDTRLELSLAKSDGKAAYADRAMDGVAFARDNVALKLDRRFTSSFVKRVDAQAYYNYIDHVMDNYTLRTPGTMFSVNNPDRMTLGGRASVMLAPSRALSLVVGADAQHNVHTFRGASVKSSAADATAAYTALPRVEDMRFTQAGLFTELTRAITSRSRVVGGVRVDWHEALDSRACVGAPTCPGASPFKNDTQGATDRKTLGNGFARFEHDADWAGISGRYSVGVGHIERSPDYWERIRQNPTTLKSAFLATSPEKTTQLGAGVVWTATSWSGSVSAFYGVVQDYVLIRWQPTPSVTRNVDATTLGAEASVAYELVRYLKADASVAFVRAENKTDNKPLAQQPPIEGRLGLTYDNRMLILGALVRLAGAQNRVDIGSGNIVSNGMDIGPTPGFQVISLNGGYRLNKGLLLTAGVDNLLNATYAEHLSKGGAAVPGYAPTTRINEPGRTVWIKVNVAVQ